MLVVRGRCSKILRANYRRAKSSPARIRAEIANDMNDHGYCIQEHEDESVDEPVRFRSLRRSVDDGEAAVRECAGVECTFNQLTSNGKT